MKPNVLVINTYGGSLLVAAKKLNLNVIGSYEDSAFGSDHQETNFPDVPIVRGRRSWPYESLRDSVVIAHPPCAGFSVQSKGTVAKAGGVHGAESAAFKCTIDVARYAMGLNCMALMIESVQPAMEGGREVHDSLAKEFGYNIYRVLQNAITFDVPQWRPRFWVVYVRPDVATNIAFTHTPVCKPLQDYLDPTSEKEPAHEERYAAQLRFLSHHGLTDEQIEAVTSEPGMLAANIRKELGLEEGINEISKKYCLAAPGRGGRDDVGCGWVSETMRILDPLGYATTIMHNSWFTIPGRTLTGAEYRRIMGFPPDYVLDKEYRMWLSKGVCPPVAEWLLEQIYRAIEGYDDSLPDRGVHWCSPGGIVDVQINKNDWYDLAGVDKPEPTAKRKSTKGRPAAATKEPTTTKRITKTTGKSKKRWVTLTIQLTALKPFTTELLEEVFRGRESAVHPPLREIVSIDGMKCIVKVQYEPPNSGGSIMDVRRIVNRAVAKLEREVGSTIVEELHQTIEDPMNLEEALKIAEKAKEDIKDKQPTRRITKKDRQFDQSSLTNKIHGVAIHRDYAAHWFRWGFVGRFIKRHDRVLDAGCGVDLMLARICQKQIKLVPSEMVCVDMNPLDGPQWAWLTLMGQYNFIERHAELGLFDVVVSFEVIEHMGMEDGRSYLRAMRACMKDDATLLLSTPVFNGSAAANHIHEYGVEELAYEIKSAGFTIAGRFGTFMNYNAMKKAATEEELAVVNKIRQYYDDEVTACFLAPLYPDSARNNIWILKK